MNYIINKKGCWVWIGSKDKDGYGRLKFEKKVWRSHRFFYEIYKGKIKNGLVIDHLCKNTSCVNPNHLEAVTQKENIKRGISYNRNKKHCVKGHPYTGNNICVDKRRNKRYCRECNNKKARDYYRIKHGIIVQ